MAAHHRTVGHPRVPVEITGGKHHEYRFSAAAVKETTRCIPFTAAVEEPNGRLVPTGCTLL